MYSNYANFLKKNLNFNITTNFFFFIIFVVIFFFLYFRYNLNFLFIHDTNYYYQIFKYIHDYTNHYNDLAQWIFEIDDGIASDIYFQHLGSLGTFFSVFFGYLGFNSLVSFLLYITFLHTIFIFGLFLNIKENIHFKKFLIIIFLYIIYTNFLNQIYFDFFFIIFIPYYYYYIKQFFKNFDINNINFLIIFFLINFLFFTGYTIIFIFYTVCLIFLIELFVNRKKIKLKYILNKNKKAFCSLFLLTLLSLVLLNIEFSIIQKYDLKVSGRVKNFLVDFNDFRFFSDIKFFDLIYNFVFSSPIRLINDQIFNDVILSFGFFLILSVFVFINNDSLKFQDKTTFYLFTVLAIVSLDIKIIDYIIFNLPYMNLVRHKDFILNLIKPLLLLFIYFSIEKKYVLNSKVKYLLAIFYFLISIFYFIYYFKINNIPYNSIIKLNFDFSFELIYFFILIIIVIIFLVNLLRFKNLEDFYFSKITFLGLLILLVLYNFQFYESNNKSEKIKFLQTKSIDFSKREKLECIDNNLFTEEYRFYLSRKNHASYQSDYLITQRFPCSDVNRSDLKLAKSLVNVNTNNEQEKYPVSKLLDQWHTPWHSSPTKEFPINININFNYDLKEKLKTIGFLPQTPLAVGKGRMPKKVEILGKSSNSDKWYLIGKNDNICLKNNLKKTNLNIKDINDLKAIKIIIYSNCDNLKITTLLGLEFNDTNYKNLMFQKKLIMSRNMSNGLHIKNIQNSNSGYLLRVSYDKNWKLLNKYSVKDFEIKNKNGYIEINGDFKNNEVYLIYENKLIYFYVLYKLIFSLMAFCFLYYVYRKLSKNI